MKAYLLVVALAVIPACGHQSDVAALHNEAVALAKYYQPKVEKLEERVNAIFKRGSTIPGNLPGIQDVGRRLQEARDQLTKLHGMVATPSPSQPSALEKQADAAAKDNNVVELQKLVDENREALVNGVTVVNDDLAAVESWIAQYDRGMLAMAAPPPPPPPPVVEPAPAPADPVNPAQPAPPAGAPQPAPQH